MKYRESRPSSATEAAPKSTAADRLHSIATTRHVGDTREPRVRHCSRCGRETERAGHPYDGLCENCDYCVRYTHVDETHCTRCGYPEYTPPVRRWTDDAGEQS